MANTYSQIYIQIIFAVELRQNLIRPENREEIHRDITGIIRNKGQKLIAINSRPDHLHMLIGMKPDLALSDLIREVKTSSTNFINKKGWVRGHFNWQSGFGAFSYSRSDLDRVIQYIQNQDQHHATKSFKDEYLTFLRRFDVAFDKKYLFEFPDHKH